MIFNCLIDKVHFYLLIEFHGTFISYKHYHIVFIYILFSLGLYRLLGLLFLSFPLYFFPYHATRTSYLFRFSSSSFILYRLHLFILYAVPMRVCSGKHSCTSSIFPIAMLKAASFFRETTWSKWFKSLFTKTNYTSNNSIILSIGCCCELLLGGGYLLNCSVVTVMAAIMFSYSI